MKLPTRAVCTIGYSGRTLDGFISALVSGGMQGVVDVRHAPVSRKPGFSKRALAAALEAGGLEYVSRPALGIPKADREHLTSDAARHELFRRYGDRLRDEQMDEVRELAELLAQRPLALMCMESDAADCHRRVLADLVAEQLHLPVVHL